MKPLLLTALLAASACHADTITFGPTYFPFHVVTSDHGGFDTFCIEANEYVSVPGTYNYTVSNATSGGDPISVGTAWLFSRPDRDPSLQLAFWWLEQEAGGVRNGWVDAAETALGLDDTGIRADAAPGAFGTWVLNVTGFDGSPAQDQLVRIDDRGNVVGICAIIGLIATWAVRKEMKS